MRTVVVVGDAPIAVEIAQAGDTVEARIGESTAGDAPARGASTYRARVARSGDAWQIALPDRTLTATVVRTRSEVWVAIAGEIYRCSARTEQEAAGSDARTPRVLAPMPGKVLEVLVEAGQQVAAGDPLVVLEAMKMETIASADAAATVTRVYVRAGVTVEPGQTLVELAFT